MKLLNVEALAKSVTKRVIVVNGNEHQIATLNVKQFLSVLEETKSILDRASNGEFVTTEEVKLTCKIVSYAVPSLSQEEIEALDLSQLQAIASFAKGEDLEGLVEEIDSGEPKSVEETGK